MRHSSAFRTFEVESCQLQKVNLAGLNSNQKTLFFLNVYNTIVCKCFFYEICFADCELVSFFWNYIFETVFISLPVHAIIVQAHKGAPGNNLYERTVFMRTAKYTIGGVAYSALDVS